MSSLNTLSLAALFAGAAIVTWIAGRYLSKATDSLDDRFDLGEALGGMILLSVAGTLPEIAITVSAAASGRLGIAAGNLIGGIAVQTCVLAIADAAVSGERPLTHLVGELMPVLEGLLVVGTVAIVIMGALLPSSVAIGSVSPASLAIVVTWVFGIALINRFRKHPRWETVADGASPGRRSVRAEHPTAEKPYRRLRTSSVVLVFSAASLATLAAGVALETSGSALADRFGLNGVVFGATILAAATALPEISTAIASVRLGDNSLVMGDIFGGNAFQVCLFLVADLIAGRPVLPHAGSQNGWLASAGIVLTFVYLVGMVLRPKRRFARLGADSWAVLALYALTVWGVMQIT